VQAIGMVGLFHTVRRTLPWAWRLVTGKIQHSQAAPASRIPMRSPDGGPASHALAGTPLPTIIKPSPQLLEIASLPMAKAA
jgi:hypothetical protein